jgi:hypothetical protein
MSGDGHAAVRRLRARLGHPVIDADGHWLEEPPVMEPAVRRIGGEAAVQGMAWASQRVRDALGMSLAERRRRRIGQEASWASPCRNVLDRATAMLQHLRFADAVRFCGEVSPHVFRGTVVARQAAEVLAGAPAGRSR